MDTNTSYPSLRLPPNSHGRGLGGGLAHLPPTLTPPTSPDVNTLSDASCSGSGAGAGAGAYRGASSGRAPLVASPLSSSPDFAQHQRLVHQKLERRQYASFTDTLTHTNLTTTFNQTDMSESPYGYAYPASSSLMDVGDSGSEADSGTFKSDRMPRKKPSLKKMRFAVSPSGGDTGSMNNDGASSPSSRNRTMGRKQRSLEALSRYGREENHQEVGNDSVHKEEGKREGNGGNGGNMMKPTRTLRKMKSVPLLFSRGQPSSTTPSSSSGSISTSSGATARVTAKDGETKSSQGKPTMIMGRKRSRTRPTMDTSSTFAPRPLADESIAAVVGITPLHSERGGNLMPSLCASTSTSASASASASAPVPLHTRGGGHAPSSWIDRATDSSVRSKASTSAARSIHSTSESERLWKSGTSDVGDQVNGSGTGATTDASLDAHGKMSPDSGFFYGLGFGNENHSHDPGAFSGSSFERVPVVYNFRQGSEPTRSETPRREQDEEEAEEEEDQIVDPKIIFSKERFLKRHSQDYGHLYSPRLGQSSFQPRSPASDSSQFSSSPVNSVFSPTLDDPPASPHNFDEASQQRYLEEARRQGRERRRSWMLQKAGLAGTVPLASESPPHNNASTDVSNGDSVKTRTHHRRTSSTTFFAPSARTNGHTRQTTLFGGPKPLTLVAAQNRRRQSMSPQMNTYVDERVTTDDILHQPFVSSPMDDEVSRNSFNFALPSRYSSAQERPERSSTPPQYDSQQITTPIKQLSGSSSSLSPPPATYQSNTQYLASPTSSLTTPQKTSVPPHLRNFSASSTSSSSLSSLGHIIAGYSPGASTSSCSSGADHMAGPRDLAPENFNFRMSISERASSRAGTRMESRLTWNSGRLNRQTSLRAESRLSQVQPLSPESELESGTEGEELPVEELMADDRREARLVRRRARAFLMAGLKLEKSSVARPDSAISVEQVHGESIENTKNKNTPTRRGGFIVEGELDFNIPDANSAWLANDSKLTKERKRYSAIRREKAGSSTSPHGPELREELLPTPIDSHRFSGFSSEIGDIPEEPSRPSEDSVLADDSSIGGFTSESEAQHAVISRPLRRVGRSRIGLESDQPAITFSVFESAAELDLPGTSGRDGPDSASSPSRPYVSERLPSDNTSNGLAGWTSQDSHDGSGRLFWNEDGGDLLNASSSKGLLDLRKSRSDSGLQEAYQAADTGGKRPTTPITPTFVYPDSAGASPGKNQRAGWTGNMRGWLRKGNAKAGVEGETEKGFGLGRGEDNNRMTMDLQTTTATTMMLVASGTGQAEIRAGERAPKEKKSWRSFLGHPLVKDDLSPHEVSDSIPALQVSQPPTSATRGSSAAVVVAGSVPNSTVTQFTSSPLLLQPLTTDLHHYSPSSANSFSLQTPVTHPTTTMMMMSSSGHRDSGMANLSFTTGVLGQSPCILSPTPEFPHEQLMIPPPTAKPYERRRLSSSQPNLPISPLPSPTIAIARQRSDGQLLFAIDTIPSQQGHHALHGLGLGLDMPPALGLRTSSRASHQPPNAPQEWKDDLARHAAALIQLSQRAREQKIQEGRQPAQPARVGLSGTQGLSERFLGIRKRQNTVSGGIKTPDPVYQSPAVSDISDNIHGTPSDLYRNETCVDVLGGANKIKAQAGNDDLFDHRSRSPTMSQEIILRQKPGALVPAQLFFLLGFLLGPWVWLFGGWALAPTGLFVSSNTAPLGLSWQHHEMIRRSRPSSKSDNVPRRKSMLPPMSRDEPNKWVTRNRWAAVVSSAVCIPAMCVGFVYLGELL